MFDRIVPRYDLMNRVMTGGMDVFWRRIAARAAEPRNALALDLATGTGDLAIQLRAFGARRVIGADFSEPMLRAASAKLDDRSVQGIDLVLADALHLPFSDQSFDCLTSGFLLRNVADLPTALSEMYRVLRPGGRAVSLEITHMPSGPLNRVFSGYFQHVVPRVGSVLSDSPAYHYLPASVAGFPAADRLSAMFQEAGFATVSYQRVGLGSVAIHTARKAS